MGVGCDRIRFTTLFPRAIKEVRSSYQALVAARKVGTSWSCSVLRKAFDQSLNGVDGTCCDLQCRIAGSTAHFWCWGRVFGSVLAIGCTGESVQLVDALYVLFSRSLDDVRSTGLALLRLVWRWHRCIAWIFCLVKICRSNGRLRLVMAPG